MKIYLKRLSYLLLSLTLLLGACDTEESFTITSPDPEFKLNIPGISSVFLNFSLPDNPAFTISWDNQLSKSSDYNVEMATDSDFTTPINLGSTDKNSFTMSVSEFNQAINNAGVTSFKDVAIYMRVKTGDLTSNNILLLVTTYPTNEPVINGVKDGDAFVLSLDNNDAVAITFDLTDPILNANLNLDIEYFIEAATPSTDFASPLEIANARNNNIIPITNSQLNAAAILSGIPVDTAGDLEIRVRSVITDKATGNVLERVGTPITINVTTYLTVLDLSTTWGIVGSAANNWGATPDLPLYKTDIDGVLVAYVNLLDGEYKFRENNDWGNNLGTGATAGSLSAGGGNIAVTAGSYKITVNLNDNTYTQESFSLGIVGGAYNEWGATPDFMLEYDPYSDVFRGMVTLIDGEMKFRMNNDWGTNWGDDGKDGTLDAGGANIVVTAGTYFATVDMNDLTYTLEPVTNVWGLVGGAYNEWGATPDAQFVRDWSKPFNDIWILIDVTLIDGEFKFRANNDWGVNYGDNGNDGTLEEGGANIVTTAGTYSFELDFTDPNAPTYKKL
jgi:hypothetical protein